MAHFAKIENNTVTQVIVVNDEDILDEQGNESEEIGIRFCKDLLGGSWIQTSYNGTIRKNLAGVGHTYDSNRDAFIGPKPSSSWVLNETTCRWEAPIPCPDDNLLYLWDEEIQNWSLMTPN